MVLPHSYEINDAALRDKVVACWEEAIRFRGWTEDLLLNMPFTLLAENVQITFISHVRAVGAMCIACDKVLAEYHGAGPGRLERKPL